MKPKRRTKRGREEEKMLTKGGEEEMRLME
jgi:hypothetical protein